MKSKDRGLWIGIGVVLSLLAIGAGVVLLATRKKVVPPDPAADREKAMAFIASEDFAKMSLAQQRAYAEKMRPPRGQRPPRQNQAAGTRPPRRPDENMTEAQRKLFRKNMHRVREAEMNERLNKFFAMSKEDQMAELDRSIEEHKKRRMNRPPRPPQAPQQQTTAKAVGTTQNNTATTAGTSTANSTAQQNNRRRPSAQDRRERDEEFSPATRAKMSAYFQLMRLREQGKLK